MNQINDIQARLARKRRGYMGCLGRGMIGLLILLLFLMVAGAISICRQCQRREKVSAAW